MKVYLMRHCLTDDGPQMDAERTLNDIGEAQAHAMRKFLKLANVRPDVIVCSDFARAHDTAKILQRGDTPIKTTPFLRPDGDVPNAWKSILKLAKDAKSVLVVTHSPLVQPLLAWVAFNFLDEKWDWEHGAVAYVNTSQGRFRWFVTPKLAAHVTDAQDPKDVEDPVLEAALLGKTARHLSENLKRAYRAAAVDEPIARLKAATAARFRKQGRRIAKALKTFERTWPTANYGEVRQAVQATIPFSDPRFAKRYSATTQAARAAGRQHVAEQLGVNIEGAVQGIEATRRASYSERTAADLERELDATTDRETGDHLKDAFAGTEPLAFAAVMDALRQQFAQYASGVDGQTSRADTVALSEISGAYHGGGASVAATAPGEIEKSWDVEDDPCETCDANNAMDWIPEDAPFDSGDFEPPAHPNAVLAGSTFRPYGTLQRMVAAEYDGFAICLHAGQNVTTIGPNHPMLTTRGFVRAEFLREGDQLVCDRRPINSVGMPESDLDKIVMVEDIFGALKARCGLSRISASADYFHGDRVVAEEKIEVVFPQDRLLNELHPSGLEKLGKIPLVEADVEATGKSGSSTFDLDLKRVLLSTPSSVGSLLSDSHFYLSTVNLTRRVRFKGWAFDASTSVGMYCSDGFVVSNCRCSVSYRTAEPEEE